jgi:hypothetical protein
MMTNAELLAAAEKELQSHAGFAYNPAILAEAINDGPLADGTVFAINGDGSKLTWFAAEVRLIKDGVVLKTMPTSEKASDMARIMHATRRARLGRSMGTPL